jgi:hypothetical protein
MKSFLVLCLLMALIGHLALPVGDWLLSYFLNLPF